MTAGIRIIDDPAQAGEALPPMDVAVLIGFAARGPLQRPVVVEDMNQFQLVFGGPVDLLVTPARRLRAHLHAAVESFFAGGGRRCHVIRVAANTAGRSRFTIAGLRLALRGRLAPDLAAELSGTAWQSDGGEWRWSDQDFSLRAASSGTWADRLELAGRLRSEAVHAEQRLAVGDLLRASRRDGGLEYLAWLRVERAAALSETLGSATAWLWLTPKAQAAINAQDWLIERMRLDLALREPGLPQISRFDCGLSAGATNLPWWEGDADAAADAGEALPGAAWPLAGASLVLDPASPDWLLLPVGLGSGFDVWCQAQDDGRDALARMGLDRYEASLFFDPAWNERLRGARLLAWADELRFLGTAPRRLQGLHGALGRDDALHREATWIALPDACHPGWEREGRLPAVHGLLLAVADPVCACPPRDFDDCRPPPPRPPQPPRFEFAGALPRPLVEPAELDWRIVLRDLAESEARSFELQLAGQADFSDARVLKPLPTDPMVHVVNLAAGSWFLRARCRRAGLVGDWSAVLELDIRPVGWRETMAIDSVCGPVHRALIDLCAATREHMALLSVPQDWDAPSVAAHVDRLRAHTAPDTGSSASFAALFHPWLLQREPDEILQTHPPEGPLLGLFARRSRSKGAWSAAGLEPLAGALALAGGATDALRLEAAGANPLELSVRGISATRANTLSLEPDWESIGVRRLLILLRRLARREGERFAFEPNDMGLRRSLERSFDALLQRLMQRGAFRGVDAGQSYALRTASGAAALDEIERGECSLLIQVAPSRPLRFLTLHVLRAGEALLIEER